MMDLECILEAVSRGCCFPVEAIKGRGRQECLCLARGLYFYIAKKKGYMVNEIGALVGRDHATVCSGAKRIEGFLSVNDKQVIKFYENVKEKIEEMSKRKQTIEIEPSDGCDNTSERFELDGFDCPYCNGRGWHSVYEGKNQDAKQCPRCGGSGRLRARVIVEWLGDLMMG